MNKVKLIYLINLEYIKRNLLIKSYLKSKLEDCNILNNLILFNV